MALGSSVFLSEGSEHPASLQWGGESRGALMEVRCLPEDRPHRDSALRTQGSTQPF